MDWKKRLKKTQDDSSLLLSESKIRVWLKHIEETDSGVIEEIVERCKVNPEARQYFLMRSEETCQSSRQVVGHTKNQ
jgi:hypothetical protein